MNGVDLDVNAERVFGYYYDVASRVGHEQDVECEQDRRGRCRLKQHRSSFSVASFYERVGKEIEDDGAFAERHPLFAAFLGDDAASLAIKKQMQDASRPYSDEQLAPLFSRKAPLGSDPEQLHVVQRALSQPITIVQGPPGTGKTQTIVNIVSCIQGLHVNAGEDCPTIAVASTNKEAVKNALTGIWELTRVQDSEGVHALADRCARLGNKSVRNSFVNEQRAKMSNEQFSALGLDNVGESCVLSAKLFDQFPIFGSTLHSLYKCFKRDEVDAFDYVIVDEGSQVPNYLGLIALRYARHMVLLGDVRQIPPIVSRERIAGVQLDGIDNAYQEGRNNSFIRTCENVFDLPIGGNGNIMLRKHYRCAPGIIEFCNQYVYTEEGREPALFPQVKRGDGTYAPAGELESVPMRVVWYEGTYYEKLGDETGLEPDVDSPRPKIHNLRQVKIFLEEELERVRGRLAERKSVCVLSPYRAPIEDLQRRLPEDLSAASKIEQVDGERDSRMPLQLTIHRAQGKAYDVVYLLSGDDYDSERPPWSQQECLVNVAVSRAREEFCVIASSVWFSPEIAEFVGSRRPEGGWNHERSSRQDEYCLKKLLEYVFENRDKATGEYGFHKATGRSVFDDVPLVRATEGSYRKSGGTVDGRNYAPQKCMKEALGRALQDSGYALQEEQPVSEVLSAAAGISIDAAACDAELRDYLQQEGSKFDFVVSRDGKPVMAIEVDGEYHRENEGNIRNDKLKARAAREIANAATYGVREVDGKYSGYLGEMQWENLTETTTFALVRIPTTGETNDEDELVLRLLDELARR